jgi:Icc-related predicted phosphoesterase
MKILAFSDLHGRHYATAFDLIQMHQPDWIVLLGDILPDFHMVGGKSNRLACQRDHWLRHGQGFELPGVPLTFVRGNHELEGFEVSAEHARLPVGIENRVIRLEGIPAEFGTFGWSREYDPVELEAELANQRAAFPGADIVLSHTPPYGTVDTDSGGTALGHKPLAAWLEAEGGRRVSLVLCGHIHEGMGFGRCGQALVVNAAGGFVLLEDDGPADQRWEGLKWRVKKLEKFEGTHGYE